MQVGSMERVHGSLAPFKPCGARFTAQMQTHNCRDTRVMRWEVGCCVAGMMLQRRTRRVEMQMRDGCDSSVGKLVPGGRVAGLATGRRLEG